MSWWRQPFTLIYVPHDGSRSRSLTLKRLTFVSLLFLGAFFISTGVLLSLFGLQSNSSTANGQALLEQKENLDASNTDGNDLHQTLAALRAQLKKTRKQHRTILKIAGIKSESNETMGPEGIDEWVKESDRILKSEINRSQQLEQIQKFVKSRNKVFRHTPTLWPTEGWLSSPYGYRKDPMGGKGKSFHDGIDIAAWHGTPVRSTADGEVIFSGQKTGYGNVVKVRHEYGYTTLYGHLSERLVSKGDRVSKGMALGRVGNTGHSTGSHVHYEVRVNGDVINPWPYLVEEFKSYQQYAMKGESQ